MFDERQSIWSVHPKFHPAYSIPFSVLVLIGLWFSIAGSVSSPQLSGFIAVLIGTTAGLKKVQSIITTNSLEVPAVPKPINETTGNFTDERQIEKTDLTNG